MLHARITFAEGTTVTAADLESLHHGAHENCFIASSVKTIVEVGALTTDGASERPGELAHRCLVGCSLALERLDSRVTVIDEVPRHRHRLDQERRISHGLAIPQ